MEYATSSYAIHLVRWPKQATANCGRRRELASPAVEHTPACCITRAHVMHHPPSRHAQLHQQ